MAELYWLQRPIAHRGLHDAAKGIVENSASAVSAAMGKGFAIEVDLQCAADHMPIVFHDDTLDRLTLETGPVAARSSRGACRHSLAQQHRPHPLAAGPARARQRPCAARARSEEHLDARRQVRGQHRADARRLQRTGRGDVVRPLFAWRPFARLRRSLPRGLVADRFDDASIGHGSRWAALRHAQPALFRHRAAQLHRLRYRGVAGARAAHRAIPVRVAASDLDCANRRRARARACAMPTP